MGSRTLARYFAGRFFVSVAAVFAGVFVLVLFVDYIDLMRRASDAPKAQASMLVLVSLCRVPQIMERLFPFSVLIGAMACFFSLSRRMELVVARGAGISVWQIITPALLVAILLGAFGSLVYNPVSANLREVSKRIELQIFGQLQSALDVYDSGYWVRQRGGDGELIMNALQSREQGLKLASIIAFTFNAHGEFKERIEAKSAELKPGAWELSEARVYAPNVLPQDFETYLLPTKLTRSQVAESFAAPDTVGFWHLPTYIRYAEDFGARRGRLSPAVPGAAGAAVPAGGDGVARRLVQPARVPLRRRATTHPDGHRRRLFDLRAFEGDRGLEQGRIALPAPRRVAADRRRRDVRISDPAARGRWVR